MDNKITKSRLSNFLSYEWILMLLVIGLAILGWEVVFSVSQVKLTAGQEYYYYFDLGVSADDEGFGNYLKNTFSYDVLEVNSEYITEASTDLDVLALKYSANEVDAVFTNSQKEQTSGEEYAYCRANLVIDSFGAWDLQEYYQSACDYLKGFLKEGETDYLKFENLSKEKIEKCFLARNGKDNRYRANLISVENENARIEKLCGDVASFKAILEYDATLNAENSIFYRYVKYEQSYKTARFDSDKEEYLPLYQQETEKIYGIKLDKLPSAEGKKKASEMFAIGEATTAENVVLVAIKPLDGNLDLQFETFGLINTVVSSFSSILD